MWQTYLDTGVVPAVAGEDQSRSTIEAISTGFLLRAGHDADSAWQAITTAHDDAFAKAKESRRRWVAWVWNRAVNDDLDFTAAIEVDGHLRLDVDAARNRLVNLAWTVPASARRSLLQVGYAVLDRVLRTGSRRVPVPERNLLLDTGLADRKTVRAALRALDGHLGLLDTATFDAHVRETTSFEFEIPTSDLGGVSLKPPPSFHTPLPPGVWGDLPASARQLWQVLTSTQGPLPIKELLVTAQLVDEVTTSPSAGQIRAARATLTRLAQVGLAQCSATGEWAAAYEVDPVHLQRVATVRAPLVERVEAERAAYRAGRSHEWDVQRAAALKANIARERAWWNGLPHEERTRRRATYQGIFEGLSVVDQQEWKAEQVYRRRRAGATDEAVRHHQWADNLRWEDVVARSAQRSDSFAHLAGPLRQAKAIAWARHREQFAVPRGTPTWQSRIEHADALPHPGADRDEAFLQEQLSLSPPDAPALPRHGFSA